MKRKTFQRAASQKYSHPFSIFLRAALLSFLLAMGGLTFLRVLLLVKYGSTLLTTTWATDLLTMLWMGGRFDAKLLATTFFFPLVLFSVPYLFSRRALPHPWMVSLWSVLQTFLFVLLWLICVVDYYYFSFFHSHLDATAWGLFEDDTRAVLHSIGTDFPVLRLFFLTLALACGAFFCGRYWIQQPYRALRPSFLWRRLTSLFLCLACVFLLARGTVSNHPLRAIHLNISRNVLINQLTNSPLFALYDVLAHADENRLETDIPKILQRWGFRDEQEALEAYTGSHGEGKGNSLFSVCIAACRFLANGEHGELFPTVSERAIQSLRISSGGTPVWVSLHEYSEWGEWNAGESRGVTFRYCARAYGTVYAFSYTPPLLCG